MEPRTSLTFCPARRVRLDGPVSDDNNKHDNGGDNEGDCDDNDDNALSP